METITYVEQIDFYERLELERAIRQAEELETLKLEILAKWE